MNTPNITCHLLMIAALTLISSSCKSMQGGAPAAELRQQLTMEVESVSVVSNRATISGSITASKPSAFTEFMRSSPSLVLRNQYDGQVEPLSPGHLMMSHEAKLAREKRLSLAAGEAAPFSMTLELAGEFPGRRQIPGMLYLSSDNGVSGHLVEPNCALLMNVVHLLRDDKGEPFNLSAKEDLLVVVVNGTLGVKIME